MARKKDEFEPVPFTELEKKGFFETEKRPVEMQIRTWDIDPVGLIIGFFLNGLTAITGFGLIGTFPDNSLKGMEIFLILLFIVLMNYMLYKFHIYQKRADKKYKGHLVRSGDSYTITVEEN